MNTSPHIKRISTHEEEEFRQTGIEAVGPMPWGTHFCQFYETVQDLIDIIIPYFREGLRANEFCMWVTAYPLERSEAATALRTVFPELDLYLQRGQIEILAYTEYYINGETFDIAHATQGWIDKLSHALQRGFTGLRLAGNIFGLEELNWDDFMRYEDTVDSVIRHSRMLALCAYCLPKCGIHDIIDVIAEHKFALIRHHGAWELIESVRYARTEQALRESEKRLRLAVRARELGVYEWDMIHDRAVFENDRMVAILGLESRNQELSATKLLELLLYPEDTPSFNAALLESITKHTPFHTVCRIKRWRDGEVRWLELSGTFEYTRDHRAARLTGIVADITERKQAEARINHQNLLLKSFNRILEEAIRTETEVALVQTCLDVLIHVTGSAFGFIGETGPDGFLHDLAISDIGLEQCSMKDRRGHGRSTGGFTINGLYGHVLESGKSLLCNDPSTHRASIGVPLGHPRLQSFLGVPLFRDGALFGMIALGNRPGGFRASDLEDVETLASAIVQVLLRTRAEKRIQLSLKEKETLLRELHHRTKNNMNVISSLISLQSASIQDERTLRMFNDMKRRILTMSLVHEKLYQSGDLSNVDISGYIRDLARAIMTGYHVADGRIELQLDMEQVSFPLDSVAPWGLIINELMTNSLKYAFPDDRTGAIRISLHETGDKAIILEYSDDGVGFNGMPVPDLSRMQSLGLKLVYNLAVRQLGSTIDIVPGNGVMFRFSFKMNDA